AGDIGSTRTQHHFRSPGSTCLQRPGNGLLCYATGVIVLYHHLVNRLIIRRNKRWVKSTGIGEANQVRAVSRLNFKHRRRGRLPEAVRRFESKAEGIRIVRLAHSLEADIAILTTETNNLVALLIDNLAAQL